MASLRRTYTASQSPLETLPSHREQQASEPTENEAFIPNELPPLHRLEAEITYPPSGPKDHVARKPLLPKDAIPGPTAIIVAGFVVGVIFAISHHLYLTFLNGRNINEYPQYWVKNANNAFSALFSMCIAFVATCALIQMKWNTARSKPLSIRTIDNLFSLPSPVALFTTVTSTRPRSLRPFLLPIFAAVFIQSLALVSVFAPNGLTVAPSAEISRDLLVPTLDLSTGPNSATEGWSLAWKASQEWTALLTSIMLQSPLLNWEIPPGCGATCKFDLVYEGPGLQCMDIRLESPPYTGEDESSPSMQSPPWTYPLVYNATSTLYQNPGALWESWWEIKDQYELEITYIDISNNETIWNRGSVHCVFRNATYKASFQVENNTMEVNRAIQSYGDVLGTIKYGRTDLPCAWHDHAPCFVNGVNTRAMCDVFASAFTGKIQFNKTSSSEVTGGINLALIDLLFSHGIDEIDEDFHVIDSNLSKSLVSLFSNLTLGFIPHRNDTTTVRADLWDGSYAWLYTVWILWAIYLPTLLLASLVILNGLLSIRSNKRGMDDKFSNFLLATKDIELDVVCIDAADFEELQQLRLLYRRDKGIFSVVNIPSEGGGGEDVRRRFD